MGYALPMDDLIPLDRGSAGPGGYMFKSIYLVKRGAMMIWLRWGVVPLNPYEMFKRSWVLQLELKY